MKFLKDVDNVTQGTILRYVHSSLYPPKETFGLIVTARCDLANPSKGVRYIHYLPIVPLQSWLNKEIKQDLLRNVFSDKFKQLDDLFSKAGLSLKASFEINSLDFIEKTLKDKLPKQINKYSELCEIRNALECEIVEDHYTQHIKKKIDEKIKRIINNEEVGYHFIPWVDKNKEYGEDFICLLREVHSINFDTAIKAKDGIYPKDFFSADKLYDDEELIWAISEICSPDIEHIMQRFGNLFTRVGVDTHRDVKNICAGVK